MTILVTGGAGFIGCAISAGLADTGRPVLAVDCLHPQIHPSATRPAALDERVELVIADVAQPDTWDELLTRVRPEVVVHLAAETGTGQSLAQASRHAVANVVGTTQLLDGLSRHQVFPQRIVLASSRAVYGEGMWRKDSGELFAPGQRDADMLAAGQWDYPGAIPTPMCAQTTAPAPASVYAATKLAQEHLLRAWCLSYGVQPWVLRLQNVYGPGQSLINPYTGILSLFCRMAMGGTAIPLYEDGLVRRDFVLIDDVARALVLAATRQTAAPALAVDIGSGQYQTIQQAAQLIAASYQAPAPRVSGQYRQGDVRHAWADVKAAAHYLGWQPEYSLAQGISQLVAWIGTQPEVTPVTLP